MFMVVSSFYDCVSALLKYRSYQKNFSTPHLHQVRLEFSS